MQSSITKTQLQTKLAAILNNAFPAGSPTTLYFDDTTNPVIDEITSVTDAMAAEATLINPIRQYPGTHK